MHSAWYLNII